MKKQIVSAIVLAGMIASSSAFASNARVMVMGTGGASSYTGSAFDGSFYYEDAYNFFYNPAYVNDYKNWAIFEKGDGNDGASAGFVTGMMNFNLGLFFNRNTMLNNTAATAAGGAVYPVGNNAVDLMLGGDTGVKWGLGLTYGSESGDNTNIAGAAFNKESNLTLRAGVSINGLDPFARFQIIGKEKLGDTDVTKYSDIGFGLRYHFGEWIPYAAYDMSKAKDEASGAEAKTNTLVVGAGREAKLAEGARLAYGIYWVNQKLTTPTGETKSNSVPLEMSVEADAMTWLTVRGGLQHVLFSNAGTETTTARVGGSFHMGKADLDYAFGNMINGAGAVTPDSSDVGFDSGTFHQVSLRYSW